MPITATDDGYLYIDPRHLMLLAICAAKRGLTCDEYLVQLADAAESEWPAQATNEDGVEPPFRQQ